MPSAGGTSFFLVGCTAVRDVMTLVERVEAESALTFMIVLPDNGVYGQKNYDGICADCHSLADVRREPNVLNRPEAECEKCHTAALPFRAGRIQRLVRPSHLKTSGPGGEMAWVTWTDPLFDGWGRAGREAI